MPSERDSQKPKQEIQTGNEGESSEDEACTRPPIARTVIEVPDSILQTYRTYRKQQERENKISRWIAIAAVAGAWIYASITAFQLCATREANTIARNAVKQTQDIMQAADRSWIGVDTVEMKNFEMGKVIRARIRVKNSGNTTALKVVHKSYTTFVEEIPESPPNLTFPISHQSEIVLTPNQTMDIPVPGKRILSTDEFNNVENGKWIVVVWSEVIYTDRFFTTGKTTLCYYYVPKEAVFYTCAKGNDAK